jgi:hypothetical protein
MYIMLKSKDIIHSGFAIALILLSSYVGNRFRQSFGERTNDEYDLIKKYLLNESPLYGMNKPKIWIHTKYDINARNWKESHARNTHNLNQPYLHLTIQSIIDHCGDDFHVCLIDDKTFSNLIPGWEVDVSILAEPMKSQIRELALAQLVYIYGGMLVPNSFICTKNLKSIYADGLYGGIPFVCETINRTANLLEQKQKTLFIPDLYFMGAKREDATMYELVEYLKSRNKSLHSSFEPTFLGESNQWCLDSIRSKRMNLIGGERIGIKTKEGKQILLEDLMEEKDLDLSTDCCGVYIPADEVLRRTKYNWLAFISKYELLKSDIAISRYIGMTSAYRPSIIPSAVSL